MQPVIISDASCLILFDNIGVLPILKQLYGSIVKTPEVASEFRNPLPEWLRIEHRANRHYQTIIEASLDTGEASNIALAMEYDDCPLIIDDLKGGKSAVQLGLHITGSMGILIAAKNEGHIQSLKPILQKIKQTNFRISEKLEALILAKAGEL